MIRSYCPQCRTLLTTWNDKGIQRRRCPYCGYIDYENPKPSANVLITRNRQVLLVRRSFEPFKGFWDIPGGFVEANEHPADGARREALEETGLEVELIDFLPMRINRYGNTGIWTLNLFYIATAIGGTAKAGDDVCDLCWFDEADLPDGIAFPEHAYATLQDWRQWLDGCRTHVP